MRPCSYSATKRRDHQLVSGLEFLAMLVPHVALRFECRIHSFSAISTTIRKALGWLQKEDTSSEESSQAPKEVVVAEGDQSEFVRLRKKSWARLEDPLSIGKHKDEKQSGEDGAEVSARRRIERPALGEITESLVLDDPAQKVGGRSPRLTFKIEAETLTPVS